jgi:hypothetical protein
MSSGVSRRSGVDIPEGVRDLNLFVSRLSRRYPRSISVDVARLTRSIPRFRSESQPRRCTAQAIKALEHYRSPKRGHDFEHIPVACVLECGGAPPLSISRYAMRPQQFLYFFPLPQGHGSLRPTFGTERRTGRSIETSPAPSPSPATPAIAPTG